jgi:uncharacterized protein YycO
VWSRSMRKLHKIFLITGALFLGLLGFVIYKVFWDPENTKQVFYPLSNQEKGLLRSGDIIMRRGYGMFSDALISVQKDKYPVSHCAMVIKRNGKLSVAHALSSSVAPIDGAQEQSLQRFLNESVPNSIIIVRFKSSQDSIQQIVDCIQHYSDIHIPFDHNFDKSDTTKMYCTELFQHCFKQVLGRDIFEAQLEGSTTGVYDLSTFQDTSFFYPIINHHKKESVKNTK